MFQHDRPFWSTRRCRRGPLLRLLWQWRICVQKPSTWGHKWSEGRIQWKGRGPRIVLWPSNKKNQAQTSEFRVFRCFYILFCYMFTAGHGRNPRTGGKTLKQPWEWLWPKFGLWRKRHLHFSSTRQSRRKQRRKQSRWMKSFCLSFKKSQMSKKSEAHFQQRSDQETVVATADTEVPGSELYGEGVGTLVEDQGWKHVLWLRLEAEEKTEVILSHTSWKDFDGWYWFWEAEETGKEWCAQTV